MIYGSKVLLRHAERSDLPHFVRWFNHPETRQFLARVHPMSMAEEEEWFSALLKDRDRYPNFFCVESLATGELIGNCGMLKLDARSSWAEFGITIADGHQNSGYGTDTVRTLTRFGFDQLNLNRIQLIVHADNPRAIHVYERCGYLREGTMRSFQFKGGHYVDAHIMAILRADWLALQGARA